MSNSYFQFKQFRIAQERCAMKVTTDACIQGAWTPIHNTVNKVLDIGAGTGLLSLMLAQRNVDIAIDAIEIDAAAAAQATENISASPWKERIHIHEGDIRNFAPTCKYDLIVTNPPFFNNSLLSDKGNINAARHTQALPYEELQSAISRLLHDDGYYSVLLPYAEYQLWKDMQLAQGWKECGSLSVSHMPGAAVKRVVGLFSKLPAAQVIKEQLVIKDEAQEYTAEFKRLMASFYLDL